MASYRIDMTARIWPLLVPAALSISLGALGVCMAFVTHGPFAPYAGTITLLGGACVLAGLILGSMVAKPVLAHDEYVAAMDRGLLLKVEQMEHFYVWGDVEAVRWDAGLEGVVIRMRQGGDVVVAKPFGTAKGAEVAAKLEDVRRKATFDLL